MPKKKTFYFSIICKFIICFKLVINTDVFFDSFTKFKYKKCRLLIVRSILAYIFNEIHIILLWRF